jgi:hypothetical protein
MSDKADPTRLQQAENELARAQHDVDQQLKIIHRVETLGEDGADAHRKLEELLEALEAAQQEHKAARNTR